jgi:hypothetical protein
MKDRDQIVIALGSRLEQAARTSVARGALYEPGENISLDAAEAWHKVADTLVALIEAMVKHSGELEKSDG